MRGFIAVAAAATLGCAQHAGRTTTAARAPAAAAEPPLTVVVENHNSADVVVTMVVQGAQGRRLGTVGGNRTGTFNVPVAVLGGTRSMMLVAHAVGGRGSYASEAVTVSGGRRAVWSLENGFTRSVLAVY